MASPAANDGTPARRPLAFSSTLSHKARGNSRTRLHRRRPLMTDFARLRRAMVDGQVRTNDVTDLRLLAALSDVPRERFVAADAAAMAYLDRDLPIGGGPGAAARYLLKPMVLARLIQAADVGPTDRVLAVACGTGYSSALLARLAATVIGLEEDAKLAAFAAEHLHAVGAHDVRIVSGPLATGWTAEAPYDVIILNGATEIVPHALFGQLSARGRLVCVLGRSPIGKGMRYRASGGHASGAPLFDAVAPLLPGFAKPPEFVF